MDLFSTEVLDVVIEDARNKKKNVESKMDLVVSLIREVKWWENAAEKAQQEVDNCTLDINLEMDELILAQQHVKESNVKRAKQVYAQRAELATEMKELQFRIASVLNEGDGCVATIDDMCKSLEKRLTSAVIKKDAADKDKLGKERALAYQRIQMEKLLEESNKLEQVAMENLKFQEFLIDRGHVLNMLQEEISSKCQDVNLLKVELEDYEHENEILVPEGYLRPKIQETIPMRHYERVVAGREEMRTNKIIKPQINDSEMIQELTDLYTDQLNKVKRAKTRPYLNHVYQESQMEKLVEESKRLQQQAMENLKMQATLKDYDHESEMLVTEDYGRPIIQEKPPMQDCECYTCCNIFEVVNGGIVDGREGMGTNKNFMSRINNSGLIQELADLCMDDEPDKGKDARNGPNLKHAYEESQMEKLVEESKRLEEQEAMENTKEMHEDSQDESEILVTEDHTWPIVQETTQRQDCECYNSDNTLEGVKRRVVASKEELKIKQD